jgi:hypothetical protein
MSDMICDICHEETDCLVSGTTCKKCYIPFKKRPDFFYEAKGNTDGRIKYPTGICGICGKTTFQPYPTGLWLHQEDNSKKDDMEISSVDHTIRPATLMELFLLENRNENRMGRDVGSIEWYGRYPEDDSLGDGKPNKYFEKRPVVKERHTECLIHRKYWIRKSKKTKKEVVKLIGSIDPCFDRRFGNRDDLKDFLSYSERDNVLQFKKFLSSDRMKSLDKNPKMPILYYYFSLYTRKYGWQKIGNETSSKKLDVLPQVGEKIKIENKTYKITEMSHTKRHSPMKNTRNVYLRK